MRLDIYDRERKTFDLPDQPTEVISNPEREFAAQIAWDAMIMGWEKAVTVNARLMQVSLHRVVDILDRAADYNDKADPQGRIHELEDWKLERQERSRLKVR